MHVTATAPPAEAGSLSGAGNAGDGMVGEGMVGEGMVRAGGLDLFLRRKGRGPALLFLHGAGGAAGWPPLLESLAARHAVLFPDHPGFGRSGDAPRLRGVGDMALFYLDLLEMLDLRAVVVIGASLGGWIAAEMAMRDRHRLRGLVLLAPAGLKVKGLPFGEVFVWSPEETARNLYADPALAEAALRAPAIDPDTALRNRQTTARLAWSPLLRSPELGRWAERLRLPVQLVWGDADRVIPPAHAAAWTERLPDARLSVIPRCGHLPHIERADATLPVIESFLERLRA